MPRTVRALAGATIAAFLLSGCVAAPQIVDTSEEDQLERQEETVAETPAAEPTRVVVDPLAVATLTTVEGYIIEYVLETWTGPIANKPSCLPETYANPDWVVWQTIASGVISRPEVNGFQWEGPVEIGGFSGGDDLTAGYAGGVCGDGDSGSVYDNAFQYTSDGDSYFRLTFWHAALKTPNSPNGIDVAPFLAQDSVRIVAGPGLIDCEARSPEVGVRDETRSCVIVRAP